MDIEFHYYMTYLIAARAGFVPAQAEIIARSAQSIDDNHIPYIISGAPSGIYRSCVSQTMDITRPEKELRKIYPVFHFIPGDPDAESARRKDGKKSAWITTPNSPIAQRMMDSALRSKNLYRIGAAAHGYVDTWAHQNFLGFESELNFILHDDYVSVDNIINVGHGPAEHKPDKPALIWTDHRLVNERVDNTARFLGAAVELFLRLARYVDPVCSKASMEQEAFDLANDLREDIGPLDPDSRDDLRECRIARYQNRAKTQIYGGTPIQDYDDRVWVEEAVAQPLNLLQRFFRNSLVYDYIQREPIGCNWRDSETYHLTHWFKFLEAVRMHQEECWQMIVDAKLIATPY